MIIPLPLTIHSERPQGRGGERRIRSDLQLRTCYLPILQLRGTRKPRLQHSLSTAVVFPTWQPPINSPDQRRLQPNHPQPRSPTESAQPRALSVLHVLQTRNSNNSGNDAREEPLRATPDAKAAGVTNRCFSTELIEASKRSASVLDRSSPYPQRPRPSPTKSLPPQSAAAVFSSRQPRKHLEPAQTPAQPPSAQPRPPPEAAQPSSQSGFRPLQARNSRQLIATSATARAEKD
jgi:hypothetical protein